MEIKTYSLIPDYPQEYSVGTVLGRMVDGIGFRYHWATEGLNKVDLEYRPCTTGRSIYDTLLHVYNLAEMMSTTVTGQRYELPEPSNGLQFDKLREETLRVIAYISDRFKEASDDKISEMSIKFKMGEQDLDFPTWNVVNGPISDLLYHIGQVVSHRRASGNPIDSKVNLLIGRRIDDGIN